MSTKIKNALGILNKKGFTLIELMIVVGIIGILVSIAAPNFARYQSKSRQAEAKIALAAVYSGEKAFYSEYNAYVGDLSAIGYVPEGLKRFYNVGWAGVNAGTIAGWGGGAFASPSYTAVNNNGMAAGATTYLSTAVAGNDMQTFTATASGQLRTGQGGDHWIITDTKSLQNISVAL